MGTRMSLETRRELLEQLKERYRWANRSERSRILDDFTASTDYARKHAIVLLNTSCPVRAPQPSRRRKYDEQVRQALTQLWNVANQICSKRLVPFLPDLIESMRRHGHLSLPKEVHSKLLTISPATMDRLLKPERAKLHKTLSATRPGSLLKKQIRVRTFADWDEGLPGFFEADLVVHCGESMAGSYLHTLVLVDIATGWTECVALLRRSEADVIGALTAVSKRLPFPLLGLDTDNGSEFINYEMLKFCRREQITFTRSRAYKKNDQAYVEEKNGSVVRRLIGYDRYEGLEAWRALTKLYSVLRDYQNFFQPSMKLQSKSRQGAIVTKRYDSARTPVQRLLEGDYLNRKSSGAIQSKWKRLDPVIRLKQLEELQDEFWKYANRVPERILDPAIPLRDAEKIIEGQTAEPRRYRKTKKARYWRTREDPFAGVWREIRLRLEVNPAQTAKDLFEDLQMRHPGEFHSGQLRTMQRRVREWRRQHLYRLSDCSE